jgi:hypothetical protein
MPCSSVAEILAAVEAWLREPSTKERKAARVCEAIRAELAAQP